MGMTSYDKGFAVGLLIGQRRMLLIIIEHRFGEISQEARDRLETFSQVQLDELRVKLRDARSIEELGLEDCTPAVIVTQGDS